MIMTTFRARVCLIPEEAQRCCHSSLSQNNLMYDCRSYSEFVVLLKCKTFLNCRSAGENLPLTQMKYFRANNLWTLWRLWAERKSEDAGIKTLSLHDFERLDFAHLLNVSSKNSQFTCRLTMEDPLRDKNTSRDSRKAEFNILEEKENCER